jgi:L-fuconolactonase
MFIVDSQVHVWAADTPERPWPPDGASYAHLPEPLGGDRLLREMDLAGVDRALLVSPTFEGDRNDLVLETAAAHPDRFGAIVRFPMPDRDSEQRLAGWAADPRVLGARVVFLRGRERWLHDGTIDWFWPVAARLELPVMVFAPGQYDTLGRIALRYPDLRLTVDHLGLDLDLRDGEIVPEVERLLPLADLPNVSVKASSLPSYVTEPFPFPGLHEPIRQVVEAFGPRRVFWGSDLSRLSCDYVELVRLFTDELAFLSQDDRRLIMGGAVCDWFGWPV